MKKNICGLAFTGLFCLLAHTVPAGAETIGWQADFSKSHRDGNSTIPAGWRFDGAKFLVPRTTFRLEKREDTRFGRALVVDSKLSTGALITIPGADLRRYPILRWRWRVRNLPPGADGRHAGRDDQAVGVYFGAGGPLSRKSVAFRWETDMPIGATGTIKYGAGIVSVHFQCVRNKTSPLNEWVEEEVNAVEEFKKHYGYIPAADQYVVSVSGNSQYTKSHTIAEIDYIELVAKPKPTEEKTTGVNK